MVGGGGWEELCRGMSYWLVFETTFKSFDQFGSFRPITFVEDLKYSLS